MINILKSHTLYKVKSGLLGIGIISSLCGLKNIDSAYPLELSHWDGSNMIQQSVFGQNILKISQFINWKCHLYRHETSYCKDVILMQNFLFNRNCKTWILMLWFPFRHMILILVSINVYTKSGLPLLRQVITKLFTRSYTKRLDPAQNDTLSLSSICAVSQSHLILPIIHMLFPFALFVSPDTT